MIQVSQVSVASVGDGVLLCDAPQVIGSQIIPGSYYDSVYGWYYLSADGIRYYADRYTGQAFIPSAFFAKYEYAATTIGGPIDMLKGSTFRVNWSFKWAGAARTITLRMGGCVKVLANYDEIGASVVSITKSVTASTTSVTYTGTTVVPFDYSVTVPKHLFILADGFDYEVVYIDAFNLITADFTELKITSYSKV